MCGIAGYSLSPDSRVDRTLAAQALLAGIAERGGDAVGYAWRERGGRIVIEKQRTGASALLERLAIGDRASEALLHVRDHTKGHPAVAANNHPVRHRSVIGVHNGTIENDEAILARLPGGRHSSAATVDSEAIFALAHYTRSHPRALERLRGSMASAWLDEREEEVVYVARGGGRPLWLGCSRREAFFASTLDALELLAQTLRVRVVARAVDEGVLLALTRGGIGNHQRFAVDSAFARTERPAARLLDEASRCRRRLAVLAGARAKQ